MIGIFGGSGFYEFVSGGDEHPVDTPYGAPAATPVVGAVDGVEVAFIPRHGADHQFPPHAVPYRANVWAMRELGVDRIIGPSAVGSLAMDYGPGDFVVCDQLVDLTYRRVNSFNDGPGVTHLSFADPYDATLRALAVAACREEGVPVHDGGTVVVIEGPRFSTRAESKHFAEQGWHVINMTQGTEVALSREAGLCYVTICVVTDYDVGVEGEVEPVTHELVLARFAENIGALKSVIRRLIPAAAAAELDCSA